MKWIFSATVSAVLASSLILSGCGDDSSSDACAYGVQYDLDKGQYDKVIATLTSDATCGGEFTAYEGKLNLAAAYMGKGGLTIGNLLGAVTESNNTSAMASFMKSFSASATADGLNNLNKAYDVYVSIATTTECATTQTGAKAEACLYGGLTTLTKSVGALSAVLGKDTLTLLTNGITQGGADDVNNNNKADQVEITGCSLVDATTNLGGCGATATAAQYVASGTLFSGDTNTYTVRKYTVTSTTTYANAVGYKLIRTDTTPDQTVTTDGLCDANKATCSAISSTCFPCAVRKTDGTATTVVDGLVTVINSGGLDTLTALLPKDSSGADQNITSDIQTSVYNACVTAGGTCTNDGQIDANELAALLNTL